ncbi:MAG: DUF2784 domain-containing protein [Rhodocyclaceae bacterium]|nr:DUF2784 domain-containing protein [Rhodocyclaceae bacterium]MCP5231457.1 DUF2784 domain-containing protein [Zoogloeaceae bacterium]MCP5239285.1 DUF2784 domain-containing protein [Zoogloeaceae bacterium]MCP5255872.1 DUF2784 domain-containing protein [Zoogloeaceae bacterium]MCW5616057.1 DUF2784 domain-containing protein [Rhodocyclaceae bacterium]
MPYQLLADLVLTLHVLLVVFVVGGLPLIVLGNFLAWGWVNGLRFRLAHLLAIVVVMAEAWLGIDCPLTTLEMWLRAAAEQATYSTSFVQYWLERLLYYRAAQWVFVLAYSLFGLLVVLAWWAFPPAMPRRDDRRRR